MRQSAAAIYLLYALLAILPSSGEAQLLGRRSRIQHLVDVQMARIPSALHLSSKQRAELRALYTTAAGKDQDVIELGGGRFRERLLIGQISRELDEKIRRILTPEQYRLLKTRDHPKPVRRLERVKI